MKRIASLDMARGFTVLMIAPIHTVMMYSDMSVRNTLLGCFMAFIAEWHGAQILMLVMGISFSFSETMSQHRTFEATFKKAALLSVFAYALNIFKFVIPHFFGWLPPALLELLQVDPGIHGYTQLFLLGDILHFASMALIILSIVIQFGKYDKVAAWMAAAICLFAPLLWDAASDNGFVSYGLNLMAGQPPRVFFPLFPWLVYPLLGLTLGKMIQKSTDSDQNQKTWLGFDSFWIPGSFLMIAGFILKYFLREPDFSSFYRTRPVDTLVHVGFILTMLSVWHSVSLHVKPNYLFKLFSYASRRITQIYIIQWVLICWLLKFVGYQTIGFIGTIFLIAATSVTTLTISLLIDLTKSRK